MRKEPDNGLACVRMLALPEVVEVLAGLACRVTWIRKVPDPVLCISTTSNTSQEWRTVLNTSGLDMMAWPGSCFDKLANASMHIGAWVVVNLAAPFLLRSPAPVADPTGTRMTSLKLVLMFMPTH